MSDETPRRLNPAAMTIEETARALSAVSGQPITVEMLQADIVAGAPRNGDGTLNLITYAAWLVRETNRGD